MTTPRFPSPWSPPLPPPSLPACLHLGCVVLSAVQYTGLQVGPGSNYSLSAVGSQQFNLRLTATITGTSPIAPAQFAVDVLMSPQGSEVTTVSLT